jgi:hypothetical protein
MFIVVQLVLDLVAFAIPFIMLNVLLQFASIMMIYGANYVIRYHPIVWNDNAKNVRNTADM